jgi:hypothetical protein
VRRALPLFLNRGRNERGIVPTEAKGVIECDAHFLFARKVRRVIEVAFFSRIFQIGNYARVWADPPTQHPEREAGCRAASRGLVRTHKTAACHKTRLRHNDRRYCALMCAGGRDNDFRFALIESDLSGHRPAGEVSRFKPAIGDEICRGGVGK